MVEGARLESVFRRKSNVGSNPTLSATLQSMIWPAVGNFGGQSWAMNITIAHREAWISGAAVVHSVPARPSVIGRSMDALFSRR